MQPKPAHREAWWLAPPGSRAGGRPATHSTARPRAGRGVAGRAGGWFRPPVGEPRRQRRFPTRCRVVDAYNPPMSLHRIHGGLALAVPPRASVSAAIRLCPLPPRLYLPLADADGRALYRRVEPGQHVRRGQALAHATDALATVLPAPTSGRVVALETLTLARTDAAGAPHLVLEPDGFDTAATLPPLTDGVRCDPAVLRRRLAEAGVVGLGGAGFPTAQKLAAPLRTLIVNGAECEPTIACDDALLRERAHDVVAGAAVLARIAGAAEIVIALQDRRDDAIAAVRAALAAYPDIRLALVPTIYPQGGERQLIEVICGREVPSGRWPVDIGIAVQNVATAAATSRAVVHGEALTTRLVSIAGRGVVAPGVLEIRIGTTIEHAIAACGGYTAEAARLILGGPLMGVALPHDAIALTRSSNAILVLGTQDLRAQAPESPCIRCGDCAGVCPVRLQPQELLHALQAADTDAAAALGLADCIECGCCAFVCPSQIPLVDIYRDAKSKQAGARNERQRADHARERHAARTLRLAREQADKVARVAARRESLAQQQAAPTATAAGPDAADPDVVAAAPAEPAAAARMDKSAVLAAIARGKARRAQRTDAPTDAAPASGDESRGAP